ncbi:MAG: GNAT family N-acetyltransferase, partial [Bacteroidota bacterium]
ADFTPCIDIGWRLKKAHWGNGYATEGAQACLEYAWNKLDAVEIYAIAVEQNLPSIRVMQKIGMSYYGHFYHPNLAEYPHLHKCVAYRIEKS